LRISSLVLPLVLPLVLDFEREYEREYELIPPDPNGVAELSPGQRPGISDGEFLQPFRLRFRVLAVTAQLPRIGGRVRRRLRSTKGGAFASSTVRVAVSVDRPCLSVAGAEQLLLAFPFPGAAPLAMLWRPFRAPREESNIQYPTVPMSNIQVSESSEWPRLGGSPFALRSHLEIGDSLLDIGYCPDLWVKCSPNA